MPVAPPPPFAAVNPLADPNFTLMIGLLAACLLVAAGAVAAAGRWLRRQVADEPDPVSGPGSMMSFRAMYENGELTEAEYAKVKARMAAKIKRQVAAANPGAGLEPVPPPAADPAGGPAASGAEGPPGAPPPRPVGNEISV